MFLTKIFVAGNPLLEIDSLPLRLMQALSKKFPQIAFEEFDPTENFPKEKSLIILDTVVGLKKVEIIEDSKKFVLPKAISLHDFDLSINLKLMQKAGMINGFKIIGVPPHLPEKDAEKQVCEKIKSSLL